MMKSNSKILWTAILCMTTCNLAQAQLPSGTGQDQDDPVIISPGVDRSPLRPFQEPGDQPPAQDQTVLLNSKYAGWQEAGIGANGDRLSNELRANWVMVDSNGAFRGQVIAGEGAKTDNMVVYLMNRGRLVKETFLSADGEFKFDNVREGAYAIIGWGSKGFFAYGLNILNYNQNASDSTPTSLKITAFQNVTSINTDWIQFFAPRVDFRVYGRYLTGEGQDDPAALYGFEGLDQFQPKAKPATSISSNPVSRTADGRLLGRVHQLNSINGRPVDVRTTRVMLLQADTVYAATNADNFGVFEFDNIPNGQYGLVAVGVDGMGLIGIDVVDEGGDFIDFCMTSSETVGWLNHYAAELAYRRALLAPRRPLDDSDGKCDVCAGNGCQTCGGTGLCVSRYQNFCEWAAQCRNQAERTKLGSGFILSGIAEDLRTSIQRSEERFDRAFYDENNFDGSNPNFSAPGVGGGMNFQSGTGQGGF